jgi:hypothetical protein
VLNSFSSKGCGLSYFWLINYATDWKMTFTALKTPIEAMHRHKVPVIGNENVAHLEFKMAGIMTQKGLVCDVALFFDLILVRHGYFATARLDW